MFSRYEIFCKVIESGSFTHTADQLGYSQSAISQTVKALEQELDTTLVYRQKGNIHLTSDGEKYMPYMQAIATAEGELKEKHREMQGLKNASIRIGTFTSVSQHLLPPLMKQFKHRYPHVRFILQQGHYSDIIRWLNDGSVDLGFTNTQVPANLSTEALYHDRMMAVLPKGHILSSQKSVTLKQLSEEPFILLDEGEYSLPLEAFSREGLTPQLEYKVYDDYSILSMVRQDLGVSLLYGLVLSDHMDGIDVRPIEGQIQRTVALAWRNWDTLPFAARKFADFILTHTTFSLK